MSICLVVGNGTIARHLKTLSDENYQFESTQRRNRLQPNYVDLGVPVSSWNIDFSRFSHVLIAAGIGGEDLCRSKPELSFKINVEGTISILNLMSENSCKPIFFSSSYINSFNPNSEEQVNLFPYTFQKWLVEQEIFSNYPNAIVFRPGKVISTELPFMREIIERAVNGHPMSVFSNYYISSTSLFNLGRITKKLLKNDASGPFNLVSEKPISYFELAEGWCDILGIPSSFLQKVTYSGVKRNIEVSHKLSAHDLARIGEVPETLDDILHSII